MQYKFLVIVGKNNVGKNACIHKLAIEINKDKRFNIKESYWLKTGAAGGNRVKHALGSLPQKMETNRIYIHKTNDGFVFGESTLGDAFHSDDNNYLYTIEKHLKVMKDEGCQFIVVACHAFPTCTKIKEWMGNNNYGYDGVFLDKSSIPDVERAKEEKRIVDCWKNIIYSILKE